MRSRSHVVSTTLSLALVTLLSFAFLNNAPTALANQEPAKTDDWSVTFGPPMSVAGAAHSSQIVMRRAPSARAQVVATIDNLDYRELRVFAISGNFARVVYDGHEGWVSLAEAPPMTMALVLDPATGRTIARVPVGAYQSDVAFSPDGSRAVVYGPVSYGGPAGTEVRMSDFATVRSISVTPSNDEYPDHQIRGMFYGGADGALYAAVGHDVGPDAAAISIVRVHDEGAIPERPVFEGPGSFFEASPDGRTGFVVRPIEYTDDWRPKEITVDVVDLGDFSVRTTWTLTGDLATAFGGYIVPNHDGSRLYLLADTSRVVAIDTATGKTAREVATGFAKVEDAGLINYSSNGRSLLVKATGCTDGTPNGTLWISDGAVVREARDLAIATDTGAARYAVDFEGRHLLRFGAGTKVARTVAIDRPDATASGVMLWPSELVATPDGSRLLLIVSESDEVCGC